MKAKSKLKDGVIEYGKIEMTDEELEEAQNVKVRTTMFLEEDLIRAYKREAAKRGLKYQQLMREKLRAGLSEGTGLEHRLRRLEQKVFKKAI
jgi:predicted DNA binding CopG/RHH family protein